MRKLWFRDLKRFKRLVVPNMLKSTLQLKKKVENKNKNKNMQTVKHTRLLEYGVLFRKKIKRNEMKAYFVQKFN